VMTSVGLARIQTRKCAPAGAKHLVPASVREWALGWVGEWAPEETRGSPPVGGEDPAPTETPTSQPPMMTGRSRV